MSLDLFWQRPALFVSRGLAELAIGGWVQRPVKHRRRATAAWCSLAYDPNEVASVVSRK
jgi:hypothetical protein